MNVLDDTRTPRVMGLKEVMTEWLKHQFNVLARRTEHRIARIDDRLELLGGYIIAYLNLDRVIEIIRYEDEPKARLIEEFDLTDVQAEAILNMRLRNLRKLEEMELRRERDDLIKERAGLEDLLGSEALQWKAIGKELAEVQKKFGKGTKFGKRRTDFADAVEVAEVPIEAMIDREPITVILSKMGWVRAMKGHQPLDAEVKFKDGDTGRFVLHAETTDRILIAGANGRFYTVLGANLPGGRGMGEPIRLMVDLPNDADITDLLIYRPGEKYLVASSDGDGFVVTSDEMLAQTKAGKQVLNLGEGAVTAVVRKIAGDHVAVVGENRKVLVFSLEELPEMARGKGVRLQRYKDGGLSDATTFTLANGLSWKDPAGRTRTETDLGEWLGKRATAGRMAPRGFPRDNRFN
jgi:topoisomerase-4 subunit A